MQWPHGQLRAEAELKQGSVAWVTWTFSLTTILPKPHLSPEKKTESDRKEAGSSPRDKWGEGQYHTPYRGHSDGGMVSLFLGYASLRVKSLWLLNLNTHTHYILISLSTPSEERQEAPAV